MSLKNLKKKNPVAPRHWLYEPETHGIRETKTKSQKRTVYKKPWKWAIHQGTQYHVNLLDISFVIWPHVFVKEVQSGQHHNGEPA